MSEFRWQLTTGSQGRSDGLFPGLVRREVGKGEYRGLEFLEVEAKTIINAVPKQSRMPFRFTINPYRGCSHACTYCFARPTHEYLGLDLGNDFDTKIVVKVNAVERLRAQTARGSWGGSPIAMGTNTDPYQAAEGKYRLTRGIIGVLAERQNPFSILTKSPLVLRDLQPLAAAAARTSVRVDFSVGTLDEDVWRSTEPGTPHPRRRLEAVAKLNAAGIPSGVLVAPVLPGLSDSRRQLAAVVRAAVAADARFISPLLLHLRGGVRRHYLDRLAADRPEVASATDAMMNRAGYAAAHHQEGLVELIDDLILEAGGRVAPRLRFAAPEPQRTDGTQLSLGL